MRQLRSSVSPPKYIFTAFPELPATIQGTNVKIHEKFDLKGSSHGRSASAREASKGSAATLKCNDFLETRIKTGKTIRCATS